MLLVRIIGINMKHVLKILNEIEATPKKLEKLAILEKNKNDVLLQTTLIWALDPRIIFGIKKIPEYNHVSDKWDNDIFEHLKLFSTREVTGNAAIDELKALLENTSPEVAEVVIRIIKKDIRAGMSKKTANKIWGKDFIPEFPCMLASSMNEKNLSKIEYPAYVQTKMDGMRAMVVFKDGGVTAYSRNGKIIDISSQFESVEENFVLDGELLVFEDGFLLNRQTGNGILNKALKGTISNEERSQVRMIAWDYIPYDDFMNGICDITQNHRLLYLGDVIDRQPNIRMIDYDIVSNFETAKDVYNEKLIVGEEGVILKNIKSKWINKRSHDLVKMKEILEADLMITDVYEGTGKYNGMLGAFAVRDKNNNVEAAVGTGFSDDQRKTLWINKNKLKGKIVSVQYNAIISTKGQDKNSLFLPVFVEVRDDKDEADIL